MIKIAVYHKNDEKRRILAKTITVALNRMKIAGKVYTIGNVMEFKNGYVNGFYSFDVLFWDTECQETREILQKRKSDAEYVLLDTPVDELSEYLLYKPIAWVSTGSISIEKAQKILENCLSYIQKKKERSFCIRTKTKSLRIPYSQILYFESKKHHILVHTLQQMEYCAFAAILDDVEKVLPSDSFLRCHQSFLVNNERVQQLDRTNRSLILDKGIVINISKKYYPDIDKVFLNESAI